MIKKIFNNFLILWLFFIIGLVLSTTIVKKVFDAKDYTNSSDIRILVTLIAKISIIFVLYAIVFYYVPKRYKFVSIFPFTFSMLIPLNYLNNNTRYLINKYILFYKNPEKIDTWGDIAKDRHTSFYKRYNNRHKYRNLWQKSQDALQKK